MARGKQRRIHQRHCDDETFEQVRDLQRALTKRLQLPGPGKGVARALFGADKRHLKLRFGKTRQAACAISPSQCLNSTSLLAPLLSPLAPPYNSPKTRLADRSGFVLAPSRGCQKRTCCCCFGRNVSGISHGDMMDKCGIKAAGSRIALRIKILTLDGFPAGSLYRSFKVASACKDINMLKTASNVPGPRATAAWWLQRATLT